MIKGLTSDLDFMRKTQVALDASSTMVRKNLCPAVVGIEKGPKHPCEQDQMNEQLFYYQKGKAVSFALPKDIQCNL